jgi:hypothetical protein
MFVDNFCNKNKNWIHIWNELKIIYKPDHVLRAFGAVRKLRHTFMGVQRICEQPNKMLWKICDCFRFLEWHNSRTTPFEWILKARLDWECEEINCVKKHKQWISSESSDVLKCWKWLKTNCFFVIFKSGVCPYPSYNVSSYNWSCF